MITIEEGLERIQVYYPQAHILEGCPIPHNNRFNFEKLLVVPSVILPSGWSHTICTVLTKIPHGFPATQPRHFWVDVELRLADGRMAECTEHLTPIAGYENWKDLTCFHWKLQAWDPNTDSLMTWLSVIKKRLKPAR